MILSQQSGMDASPAAAMVHDRQYSHGYGEYVRPDLRALLDILRLDLSYSRAFGSYVYYQDGQREQAVLDLVGGYGASLLGHHSAVINAIAADQLHKQTPVFVQGSIKKNAVLLAKTINHRLQAQGFQSKYYLHLTVTGAEAVESALAYADTIWRLRLQQLQERQAGLAAVEPVVVAVKRGFHGKTRGALNLTSALADDLLPLPPKKQALFVDPDMSITAIRDLLTPYLGGSLPAIAAVIWEPVQVEGGVNELSPELVDLFRELNKTYNIPLIVDEIQTGCYRTGTFLAETRLEPDFILLGKALGGGLAKISTCLIRADRYQENMGIFRTSTFAEDEFSSGIALGFLEYMQTEEAFIAAKAAWFADAIRDLVQQLQTIYPGVIQRCSGRGLIMGLHFARSNAVAPHFFKAIDATGYLGYFYASYLLHQHHIRITPCLSQPQVLRLEPTMQFGEQEFQQLKTGLTELVASIYERRLLHLSSHLWNKSQSYRHAPLQSPTTSSIQTSTLDKVIFLSHIIDDEHIQHLDPVFAALSADERQHFLSKARPIAGHIDYFDQIIKGANGRSVHLILRGITLDSHFFAEAARSRNRAAFHKVRRAFNAAVAEQSHYVGLGQYTSIVSHNGLRLAHNSERPYLTTGNSLTVALAFAALRRICAERGIDLSAAKIGVVGALGNIGAVLAELCAAVAGEVYLVGRESSAAMTRLQAFVESRTPGLRSRLKPVTSDDLVDCDAIVLATSSADRFFSVAELKHNAIVLDLSVPSNIDHAAQLMRPDISCFAGGYACLPEGQQLLTPLVPTPNGEVYGCMAETLTLALAGYRGDFSLGAIHVAKIGEIMQMANQVGIELGSLKYI